MCQLEMNKRIGLMSCFIFVFVIQFFLFIPAVGASQLPILKWVERPDWINVKTDVSPAAVGDGVTDDTAAIQAAMNLVAASSTHRTVYFPSGTYRISQTLTWGNIYGVALIGDGRNTTIKWYGAVGGTMFWSNGATRAMYLGLNWDGNSDPQYQAAIGVYHHSTSKYEHATRHKDEAFRNFSDSAIKSYGGGQTGNIATAETMIWNCLFENCGIGINNGSDMWNSYQWIIKNCEFRDGNYGYYGSRGKSLFIDTRFERNLIADIYTGGGSAERVRRCTSVGSGRFFDMGGTSSKAEFIIQDCSIDGWTNPNGAIELRNGGTTMVFDCIFTNPPNLNPVIKLSNNSSFTQRLIVSNNQCAGISDLIDEGANSITTIIPQGQRGSNLVDSQQSFFQTSVPAEGIVIDVTQPPYNAVGNGIADDTQALNAALSDAKKYPDCIVYFPTGRYLVTSTLNVNGGPFKVQGSGSGFHTTILIWNGPDDGIIFGVTDPENISIENLEAVLPLTASMVQATALTACQLSLDRLFAYYIDANSDRLEYETGRGVELVGLPIDSVVTIGGLSLPLTVIDCGPATILMSFQMNRIIVKGASNNKTGILGALVYQGGVLHSGTDYDLIVDDNQNIVIADWYIEQASRNVKLSRGNGTGSGQVTIQGVRQHSFSTNLLIEVNNYQGRFQYGPQTFKGPDATPVQQINHTGSNAFNFSLLGGTFEQEPVVTQGSGFNFIRLASRVGAPGLPAVELTDLKPVGWESTVTASLDDLRRLGDQDLQLIAANNGNGLWGKYYSNMDFTGQVVDRVDRIVDFNWGYNPPRPQMKIWNYSIRWSGFVQPRYTETYTFRMNHDDSVKLWVNGQLLIDQAIGLHEGTISLVAGQKYDIRIDYTQNGGVAYCQLYWQSASQSQEVIPTDCLFASRHGLQGEYYDNIDFTNLLVSRVDPVVDYTWTSYAPLPQMQNASYSVKWSGFVQPRYTETYTFRMNHDDSVKLWVNGQLLIDQATGLHEGTISLVAGQKYDIRIDYTQNTGNAYCQLYWKSKNQVSEIIPMDCLFVP